MLYHFLYDPADPRYPYAIFSDDMTHSVVWEEWSSNKYIKEGSNYRCFPDFIDANPRFVHIATYDYPILPSEIIQLHPEYFI